MERLTAPALNNPHPARARSNVKRKLSHMSSTEMYLAIKSVHLTAIAVSVALFAARWTAVLRRQNWPMQTPARRASVAIDTVLLTAGLGLWWTGGWTWQQSPWLQTKLLLLVVYVVLGTLALKKARTLAGKQVCGLLAIATVVQMAGVATLHHPLGWLALWPAAGSPL